jgi:hypothetical protein
MADNPDNLKPNKWVYAFGTSALWALAASVVAVPVLIIAPSLVASLGLMQGIVSIAGFIKGWAKAAHQARAVDELKNDIVQIAAAEHEASADLGISADLADRAPAAEFADRASSRHTDAVSKRRNAAEQADLAR